MPQPVYMCIAFLAPFVLIDGRAARRGNQVAARELIFIIQSRLFSCSNEPVLTLLFEFNGRILPMVSIFTTSLGFQVHR
jgi:hypothetical protein